MILQSEISNEGMVLIMEKLHTYVPTVSTPIELECPKSDEPTTMIKDDFHYILKGGDQLIVARARSSKCIRSNSLHPLDRLEGLIPVCEDWHAKGCLISVSLHAHVTTRKMVPITGRARSFLLVFKNKIERRGRQNKNNRPINLPNVITFSTDFKYTTQSYLNHTQ